jgi:hypothetical protein
MTRLRSILVVVGTVILGGVSYLAVTPRADITRADLLDAGLAQLCEPALMECRVRSTCNAGAVRYGVVRTKVGVCDRGAGNDVLVFRWPRRNGSECVETVGTPSEACRLVEAIGTCTDATLCAEADAGTQPITEQTPACACRMAAGTCTWTPPGSTARTAPFGNTMEAGTWSGAGCFRKYCGPVRQGDADDWPSECPR